MKSRFGSKSDASAANAGRWTAASQRFSESAAPERKAELSTQSNETEASAVRTVSHKAQRKAAAAITNRKNRKNGLLCPVVNNEIAAGKTTSAPCTNTRKGSVVRCRERSKKMTRSPWTT